MAINYVKLGELAEVIGGQIMTRVKAENADDEVLETRKVLIPKAITDTGLFDRNALVEERLKSSVDDKKITHTNDIVMKLNSPFGGVLIDEMDEGYIVPSFCCIIRTEQGPGRPVSAFYLNAFLNSKSCKEQMSRMVQGNIMSMMTIGKVKDILVPVVDGAREHAISMTYLETLSRIELLSEILSLEKMKNDAMFRELEG